MDLVANYSHLLLGMSFMNHLVGGFVFTGVFCSICGINILKSEWYIAWTAFAAVLPDVDHPAAPTGKLFLPISKWIHRNWGHRTITHSWIFLGATTFIVGYIESFCWSKSTFTAMYFFGVLSHSIFDMMTIRGVAIFYPFNNAIAVIPGDENLRFTSSNRKVELSIFGFFCLCFFLLTPLFESGFWTQYNRAFGTTKHLFSEFRKSSDLLEVEYSYRIASDEYEGRGLVIESTIGGATLLTEENNKWLQLDKEKMIIERVIPIHTGRAWQIEQVNFVAITSDSLNNLIDGKHNLRTEIHSNNEFSFYFNGKEERGRVAKAVYFHQGKVREELATVEKEQVTFKPSPRIKTLQFQIADIRKRHNEKLEKYRNYIAAKTKLEESISEESDLFEREKSVRKLARMKSIEKPTQDSEKIAMLAAQIRELKTQDARNHQTRLTEVETNYRQQLPEESHFTGYLKFVTLQPSSQLSAK